MRRIAVCGRSPALGLLLLALAGCRTPDYADVAQGPTAELLLLNESGRVADAALYQDPARCRARSLVRPAPTPGQGRRVMVRADGEVTVSFFQDIGVSSSGGGLAIEGCAPTLTFRAEPGAGYAVRYRNCTADVVQISQAGTTLSAPRPVDARRRAYVRAFDDTGPFCRD